MKKRNLLKKKMETLYEEVEHIREKKERGCKQIWNFNKTK